MKSMFSIFLLLTLAFQATTFASQEEDKKRQAWTNTGLNFELLQKMPGFTSEHCKASVKNLTNCVIALDYLAGMLPEPLSIQLKSLPKDEGSQYVLAPTEILEEYFPYLTSGPDGVKLREYFQNGTKMVQGLDNDLKSKNHWVDALRKEIFSLAGNIPQKDQAWIASRIYNRYLGENQDPHSAIVPNSTYSKTPGVKYSGIGTHIWKFKPKDEANMHLDDGAMLNTMPGSPAEAAGLKAGDVLLEIEGEDIKGMDLNTLVSKILGPADTEVSFKYHSVCEQTVKDVTVTRGQIDPDIGVLESSRFVSLELGASDPVATYCENKNSVTSNDDNQAMYIPVSDFMDPDLCTDFNKLLEIDLSNPKSHGIIVDLRNNSGGYLHLVSCMLNSVISDDGLIYDTLKVSNGPDGQFVTDTSLYNKSFDLAGPMDSADIKRLLGEESPSLLAKDEDSEGQIAVQDLGEAPPEALPKNANWAFTYNRKIVVLTNTGSASASEIFAGTVQDKKRGWIVGLRTFGKGSVQGRNDHFMRPGPSDQVVKKETEALYVLASGRSPQGKGITPDFVGAADGQPYTPEDLLEARGRDEASLHNSIQYEPPQPWTQTQPDEVSAVINCVNGPSGSLAMKYLEKIAGHPGFSERVPFQNYQNAMAKDIMACSVARDDVLKTIK